MPNTKLAALASATLILGGIAACGSSNAGSGGAASGGSVINVGITGIFSAGPGYPGIPEAAQARVDSINAAGGIGGRKLKLISCNDDLNVNTAVACAQKLVQAKVVALLSPLSAFGNEIYPVFNNAHIPVIGTTTGTPSDATFPASFPITVGALGGFAGMPAALRSEGATKVGLLDEGDLGPVTLANEADFAAGEKASGFSAGPAIGVPGTATDFGPYVAKALKDGVNGLGLYLGNATSEAQLAQAILQQDPKMKIVIAGFGINSQVISALGATASHLKVVLWGQPATATSEPGIAMFDADMKKYASSAPLNDLDIQAWSAVWLFQRVAGGLGKDITGASVLAAMNKLHNMSMGGIYPPLTTTTTCSTCDGATRMFNPTIVVGEIVGGKVVAVDGKFVSAFSS
jgi:ABC-type branched-subunit amino acid transport system substrate-binding protein